MPALNGCICGTVLVTCIESLLPRADSASLPQTGSSRRVMCPARTLVRCRLALVANLLLLWYARVETPGRPLAPLRFPPSRLQALKKHMRRLRLITTEKCS